MNINYTNIRGNFDNLPQNVKDLLDTNGNVMDELEYANCEIRYVPSPFTLADNAFDLSEDNNELYEFNVKRIESVSFTGGACLLTYEKINSDELSIIVHGNLEQGYNIFQLI